MTLTEARAHAATAYDVVDSRPMVKWIKNLLKDELGAKYPGWGLVAALATAAVDVQNGRMAEALDMDGMVDAAGLADLGLVEAYAASQGLT